MAAFSSNLARQRFIPKQKSNAFKVHRSVKMRMEAGFEDEAGRQAGKKYKPKPHFAVEPLWIDWEWLSFWHIIWALLRYLMQTITSNDYPPWSSADSVRNYPWSVDRPGKTSRMWHASSMRPETSAIWKHVWSCQWCNKTCIVLTFCRLNTSKWCPGISRILIKCP